jgi:hypothetical protein
MQKRFHGNEVTEVLKFAPQKLEDLFAKSSVAPLPSCTLHT